MSEKEYNEWKMHTNFSRINNVNIIPVTKQTVIFSIAFSAKSTASDVLVENIKKNTHFAELSSYQELIFVAVNI